MRKLNKKGFTLVELLAVIAILAVLMLLVTPSVLKLFTEGKKSVFVTQVQSVWKAAESQYVKDAILSTKPGPYCYKGENVKVGSSVTTTNALTISDNKSIAYYVDFNDDGQITKLIVTDGTYYYAKYGATTGEVGKGTPTIDVSTNDVKEANSTDTFACGTYTTE